MGQSASLLLCSAAGAVPAWRPPGPCEPRWPRVWTPDEMDSWAPLLAAAAALAGLVAGAVVCVAAHEAAHVAAAAALGLVPLRGPRGAAEAARGAVHRTLADAAWLPLYLLTGAPAPAAAPAPAPHVELRLSPGAPPGLRLALARHAGWLASALLAAAACRLAALAASAGPVMWGGAAGVAAAAVLVLLGALASDLLRLEPAPSAPPSSRPAAPSGVRLPVLFCGNVGLLVAAAGQSGVDIMAVLKAQVAISSQRGAQSGGLVALVDSGREAPATMPLPLPDAAAAKAPHSQDAGPRPLLNGIRSRVAPGKRDHLSLALSRRFGAALGRRPLLAGGHGIFVGHTRFATSSQPSEGESHPHQWSPPAPARVWRANGPGGRLTVGEEHFGVWITHNGDFDFWRLMGQDRTHSEVAAFLTSVLGTPAPAKCDSVRVAGMIELLRTQGLWLPSLRLAYFDSLAHASFADVLGGEGQQEGASSKGGKGGAEDAETGRRPRMASRAELAALASALEAAFASAASACDPDDPTDLLLLAMGLGDLTGLGHTAGAMSGAFSGALAGAYLSNDGPPPLGHSVGPQLATRPSAGASAGAAADGSRDNTAHGAQNFAALFGVGAGRPSIAPADAVSGAAGAGPAAGTGAGAGPEAGLDFLLERRPSFSGLAGDPLTSAVLAARAQAAITQIKGGQGGARTSTAAARASLDAPFVPLGHGLPTTGPGSHQPQPHAEGCTSGSLEVRTRPRRGPYAAAAMAALHASLHGEPAGVTSWGSHALQPRVRSTTTSQHTTISLSVSPAPNFGRTSTPQAPPAPRSSNSGAASRPAPAPAPPNPFGQKVAGVHLPEAAPAKAPTQATVSPAGGAAPNINGKGNGVHTSAAATASGEKAQGVTDIPVSYGQEALRLACALGLGRAGAQDALVRTLAAAARKHLESTPGWPAWSKTVLSLEALVSTALSYFVANDLYTASCRFLKAAKGSFGLAILCSLEPDRLCMGAWGQPMSMSFSQQHKAVLYGSETNCAMIPIPTRDTGTSAPAAGVAGDADASAHSEASGKAPAAGDGPSVRGRPDDNIVAHARKRPVRVTHDLLQQTSVLRVQLRGDAPATGKPRASGAFPRQQVEVEVLRDVSRYSAASASPSAYNGLDPSSGRALDALDPSGAGRLAAAHAQQSGEGPASGRGSGLGAGGARLLQQSAGAVMPPPPPAPLAPPPAPPPDGGYVNGVDWAPAASYRAAASLAAEGGVCAVPLPADCTIPPLAPAVARPRGVSFDLVTDEMHDKVQGYDADGTAVLDGAGLPLPLRKPFPRRSQPGLGDGGNPEVGVWVEDPVAEEECAHGAYAFEETEELVDNGWGPAFATHRIDIDEGGGEMMQLVLTDPSDPDSAADNADGWALFRRVPFVRLRVFQIRGGVEVDSREDFEDQERIVQLVGNPYVSFSPALADLAPGRDYVADDLADVPRVLARIRESWTDPLSLNRQTAEELYGMIDKLAEFALRKGGSCAAEERPGVDLLVTGVEASLWLAEQWAGDLKLVFPQLNVQAVSANKIISTLGNARGRIPPTGSTFCRNSSRFLAEHHTLCIAVSQSGQTFPTIHAARILHQLLPGRVFALCGSVDTKMALALGQRLALSSPWGRRVLTSCAGGRCAEPPSVVAVALHQTLSELLAFLVVRMRQTSVVASGRPLGMILSKDDMVDLRSVRDRFIDHTAPQLTGRDAQGQPLLSAAHDMLVRQGRSWALHVIESPTAWVLSLVHILATVVSGWPLVYAAVHGVCLGAGASHALDTALSKVALAVDSVIYMFLPIIYAVLLRALQGRPLWHRMGKRTIVVADVPYVHQILETFVSKMYALSYGIASVEVHGANPLDHFVHRFTHRVVRGLLIALGRPDGRLYSQTKSESWVLLGLLQAKVITSWGHQPEVVSVGHNPYHPPVVDTHLCLPTNRPRLLVEALEHGSGEAVDPNQLWARRRHMVTSKFPLHDRARELLTEMEDGAAEGAQAVARGASRALVRGRSGALASAEPSARGTPKVRSEASVRGGSAFGGVGGSTHGPAGTGGSAYGGVGGSMHGAPRGVGLMRASGNGDTSVRSGRALQAFGRSSTRRLVRASTWARLQGGACSAYSLLSGQDVLDMSPEATSALLGPASKHLVGGHLLYTIFKKAELRRMWDKLRVVRQLASRLSTKQISEPVAREAVAAVGSTLEDVLTKQSVMEQLLESRYLSLERLLSFMVMFHAMARRTADWWPLTFDISRSQSGLRVATTAAPVTASELEQSLAETLAGDVVEEAAQRGERERRDRLQAIMASHLRRRRPVVGSAPVME